jgi:hypothetical protein
MSPDTPLLPVKETSNTPDAFGDEFVALWEMYPRKDDSSKALKAYSVDVPPSGVVPGVHHFEVATG